MLPISTKIFAVATPQLLFYTIFIRYSDIIIRYLILYDIVLLEKFQSFSWAVVTRGVCTRISLSSHVLLIEHQENKNQVNKNQVNKNQVNKNQVNKNQVNKNQVNKNQVNKNQVNKSALHLNKNKTICKQQYSAVAHAQVSTSQLSPSGPASLAPLVQPA